MKKSLLIFPVILSVFSVNACNKQENKKTNKLENCAIHHDDEFGGAYINIGIQEFNDLGFAFGDSMNLVFTTGDKSATFEDIGYYSGYYVPSGQELVVGYKGYENIKFCINYGEDIYASNEFNENTKVTITINKAGKYKDVEETLSISYSDDPTEYENKEMFANFRAAKGGALKEGLIYRGASPIDDSRNRTEIVDDLLAEYTIRYDIDLADKESSLSNKKYVIHDNFKSLQDNNQVIFLGMGAAYKNDDFSGKLKTMFEAILNNDGPYYIHCLEGKDRTGYVCMVIEALMGATYDELIEDYFITYHNYYGIEKGTSKYDMIKSMHIDEMIRYVFDFAPKTTLLGANFKSKANDYLLAIGLTQAQIDAVQTKLMA